jgi:hypothetical protein
MAAAALMSTAAAAAAAAETVPAEAARAEAAVSGETVTRRGMAPPAVIPTMMPAAISASEPAIKPAPGAIIIVPCVVGRAVIFGTPVFRSNGTSG